MIEGNPQPLNAEELANLEHEVSRPTLLRLLATIRERDAEVARLRKVLSLISYKTHHTHHPMGLRAPGVLPGMWHSLSFTDPEIEMIDEALAIPSPGQ